jgi:hypothetical protein
MKRLNLLLGLTALALLSFGQTNSQLATCEFSLSVNRSNLNVESTEDKVGFGIGICYPFFADKRVNLLTGLEYNHTSWFINSLYESHFSHSTDLTYTMNCISIPIGLRLNTGTKTNFFVEAGGFADITVSSNRKGTMHLYSPDENNHLIYYEYPIDQDAGLSNSIGAYIGVGISIPFVIFDLIIKPEYKMGLNNIHSNMDEFQSRYFRVSVGIKFH